MGKYIIFQTVKPVLSDNKIRGQMITKYSLKVMHKTPVGIFCIAMYFKPFILESMNYKQGFTQIRHWIHIRVFSVVHVYRKL